jgi:hypothetical protein
MGKGLCAVVESAARNFADDAMWVHGLLKREIDFLAPRKKIIEKFPKKLVGGA